MYRPTSEPEPMVNEMLVADMNSCREEESWVAFSFLPTQSYFATDGCSLNKNVSPFPKNCPTLCDCSKRLDQAAEQYAPNICRRGEKKN